MTREIQEACFKCKFWIDDDDPNQYQFGNCRRYPPTMDYPGLVLEVDEGFISENIESAGETLAFWTRPRVIYDDWCGEFVCATGYIHVD